MLTCVIRTQVKEIKMEVKNTGSYIFKNIIFETFKILNA